MPLHLVPKRAPRKRARETDAKPAEMLQCRRCGGREVIETKVGMTYSSGKAKGGTKSYLCACCYSKGERVTLA